MTTEPTTPANGDQTEKTTETAKRRRLGRPSGINKGSKAGHRIPLPDGDCLRPVFDLATDHRVSERTIKRKMHTVRHGGVSYGRDKFRPPDIG